MDNKKIKHFKVLGIAAGQGALLYPFLNQKNCTLLGNVEPRSVFHTPKEQQWKLNFGDIPFSRKLNLDESIKPNVIVSSPDCGASSVMRLSKVKQLGNPEKNESLNLVIEGILYYRPKVFLIENLPRLLSLVPRAFFEETFKDYDLVFHEASVSQFGNSQVSRKRLVIIGIKKKTSRVSKNQFKRVFLVNTPKVSRECLKPAYLKGKNTNYMIPLNKTLAMYDYRKLPEKKNLTVEEIHKLWNTDFKNEKKWPIKTAKMSTLPGVYRLEADKAPLTVRPADRQFRPDGYPLGTEDFKSLMGFPDSYRIFMDEGNYLYWLNKSRYTLCKGSVYEVGEWFLRCLLI
jgi:site-specific DNA-cytosine methylase